MALELDAIDEIDRNRHVLFAEQVQKGILQKLAFVAHRYAPSYRGVGDYG
jgi:hypothetical protein